MRHMDLFSGIGGFALAASWVWGDEHEIVTFCEKEEFPRRVLKKHWPDVPCNEDIFTLNGGSYGAVDLVTGGFPCQPFSQAGKQKGKEDDRYLWPETLRIIQEAKPRWFIGENVAGIINLALDEVLASLEGAGYSTETFIIPACAINSPHRRDRVWIIANSDSIRIDKCSQRSNLEGKESKNSIKQWDRWTSEINRYCGWEHKARFHRDVNGIPGRVDRLRALGNAIVPQVAAVIMSAIKEVDRVL